MILDPDASITESQRQAVSALLYDVGVSIDMPCSADGSSSSIKLQAIVCGRHVSAISQYEALDTVKSICAIDKNCCLQQHIASKLRHVKDQGERLQ